ETLPAGADNSGEQRLVSISLRQSDIIFETTRDRCPPGVNGPQRCVAIGHGFYAHLKSNEVVDLLEAALQSTHFAVQTRNMPGPSGHLASEPAFVEQVADRFGYPINVLVTFLLALR